MSGQSNPPLPWDIQQARDAFASATREQKAHQETVREAVKAAALADQRYRIARARVAGEMRDAGKPAVMCDTLARGDEEVAELARAAAVAEGDREIAVQEGWRLHANRKDTHQLATWSMRRDLAVDYGDDPEPDEFQNVTPRRVA